MRGYVPDFEVLVPNSLQDALKLLAEGGVTPLAGGTDLMVLLNGGKLPPTRFLDLWGLQELRGIQVLDHEVRLGALTTYTDVQRHPLLQKEFPNLVQAAALSGALAIQNRGTLGGNIVNASPAADSPPALLTYHAQIELTSWGGASRRLDYAQFHTGYKTMQMQSDELVTAIILPRRNWTAHFYRKVGTRKAQAISKVCLAATAAVFQGHVRDIRIAVGSVAPTVVLATRTAEMLEGHHSGALPEAVRTAFLGEISPIDDIRSNARYRAKVAANLVEEFWISLSM